MNPRHSITVSLPRRVIADCPKSRSPDFHRLRRFLLESEVEPLTLT